MSTDNKKSNEELKNKADQQQQSQQGKQTGPVAGGADNTRGENKPSTQGKMQSDQANLNTTTRGADSTDKEFRNDQPNASTLKSHKNSADLDEK
ncbi:hypothetical protein ACXYMU_10625 [Pontibacter sp. CAU 1760]